jgi:hypothetical protein
MTTNCSDSNSSRTLGTASCVLWVITQRPGMKQDLIDLIICALFGTFHELEVQEMK